MRIFYLFCLIIANICLSGCNTLYSPAPPVDRNISWEKRADTLKNLDHFDVNGMVAVRASRDSGSAMIRWQQKGAQYSILLYGPLGFSSFHLTGSPGHVTLKTADGRIFEATTPEAILLQQTGWNLPVSNLFYWMRGLPVPNMNAQKQFDSYHHLVRLQQGDWLIEYSQYTSANQIDLPKKIHIQNNQVIVKVFINQWKLY